MIYLHILKQGPSLKRLGLSRSVRIEEMAARHRFELQSETKQGNHQQSTKLRKCLSRSHCRKGFILSRLRVVPHFSSELVERAKRERA